LAENLSFDVLTDKIRPAVFAVGDKNKKGKESKGKGREGKVYTKSQDVIFQLFWGGHLWPDSRKICPKQHNQYVQF